MYGDNTLVASIIMFKMVGDFIFFHGGFGLPVPFKEFILIVVSYFGNGPGPPPCFDGKYIRDSGARGGARGGGARGGVWDGGVLDGVRGGGPPTFPTRNKLRVNQGAQRGLGCHHLYVLSYGVGYMGVMG